MSMSEGKQKADKQMYSKMKRECKPLASSGLVRYLQRSWTLCHILKLKINDYGQRKTGRVFFHSVWKIYGVYEITVSWNSTSKQKKAFIRGLQSTYTWKTRWIKTLISFNMPSSITLLLNVNICVTRTVSTFYRL